MNQEINASTDNADNDRQSGSRKRKSNREKTTLISHNIMVDGRRTSVRLEKEMWMAIKEIARREDCTVHALCSVVALRKRPDTSLTAAIRVFIMAYFQAAATDDGHVRAGHGRGAQTAGEVLSRHHATPYYGLREFKTLHN
jgi:predicted DNA-binding ribbon-helix-helix protein